MTVVRFDEGHDQVSLTAENVAKGLHFHVSHLAPHLANGSGQSTAVIVTQPHTPTVSGRFARSLILAQLVNLMQLGHRI